MTTLPPQHASLEGLALARFQPLHPAEAKVVSELQNGDFDRLGDGLRPDDPDPERIVRGEFLRFLLLGGEPGCRPHEKGVRVTGAWIAGVLDLEGCRIPRDIGLNDCRFEAPLVLRSAIIDSLFLDGSALPSLVADRIEARGGLALRSALVTGEISLSGASLGGELEGDGLTIERPGGLALSAPGISVRSVLLRGATVSGGIDLSGARVRGGMDCRGMVLNRLEGVALNADALEARGNVSLRSVDITGEVRLLGVRVGGDLDCAAAVFTRPDGDALQLGRAVVEGGFFLRDGAKVVGTLDMTGATIGTLHDDAAAWPAKGDLLVNRCQYEGFIDGPVDARTRLDWLSRQSPERYGEDFWPQPYEQLASVFRGMGHDEDARAVLIEKEKLQRAARRARTAAPWWRAVLAAKDGLLAITVAYGRQPLLAFLWLAVFWLAGVGIFAVADEQGALKPNNPVVLRSPEWTQCRMPNTAERTLASQDVVRGRAEPGQSQLDCFRSQFEMLSYPEFNPWMFSLDTLFPVFEIGQKDFWRPDPVQPWGQVTIGYYYFESIVGWALSLLAVAGFSGLVKSR